MCIIIIQPEGHVFSDEAIVDFYDRNPQGFGFMWTDKNGLHGVKELPSDEMEAIEAYHKHAAGVEGIIHFRFATSGPTNLAMAHPFKISKDLLVMHNGVLPGGDDHESDTAQFVREVLKPTLAKDYRALGDPSVIEELESMVVGSSVVFMDKDGVVTVLGRKGVWHEGCWYSNTYAWTLPVDLGGPGLDRFDERPW